MPASIVQAPSAHPLIITGPRNIEQAVPHAGVVTGSPLEELFDQMTIEAEEDDNSEDDEEANNDPVATGWERSQLHELDVRDAAQSC